MAILHTFVLAAMALLAPGRDHERLGSAIVRVVESEPPLFRDDDDRIRTAGLVVAVAFREGSLIADVVGDHGASFCTMQIHVRSGGSRELVDDPDACIRAGVRMLRQSIATCREHPIAWYASGPAGCTNARAQRISRDRVALGAWLSRTAPRE